MLCITTKLTVNRLITEHWTRSTSALQCNRLSTTELRHGAACRRGKIDARTRWDDPGRVDGAMAAVIVRLDVVEMYRFCHTGYSPGGRRSDRERSACDLSLAPFSSCSLPKWWAVSLSHIRHLTTRVARSVSSAVIGLIAGGKDFAIITNMCAKYGLDPRTPVSRPRKVQQQATRSSSARPQRPA
jgi:hypothetical protein